MFFSLTNETFLRKSQKGSSLSALIILNEENELFLTKYDNALFQVIYLI